MIGLATQLTNDAVLYALAASVAFLATFLIFDPGLRKTSIGKSLIMLDVGLTMLEAPSVLHRFLGLQISQAGFAWYFLATVAIVGTSVWWRTLLMVSAQLRGRKRQQPEPQLVPEPCTAQGEGQL